MKMDKPVKELLGLPVQDLSTMRLLEQQSEKKDSIKLGGDWYYTDEMVINFSVFKKSMGNSIISIIQSLQA